TPQPVVSSRYLFLCSPPKMVLMFRPESRATLMKFTSISRGDFGRLSDFEGSVFFEFCANARMRSGSASERTLSSDNMRAERLRDLINLRREKDKGQYPPMLGSC